MQKQKSPGMGEHRAVKRILPPAVALAISLLGVEAKELHGMPAEVRQQLPSIKTEITEPGRQDRQGEIRRVVRVRPTRARRRINAPLPYTRMHSRRGARIRRQMLQQRASSRLLEEKRLSPDDAPTLAALSNHHDPEIRLQAVQSLQKIGPQSFTHLTKFLSDPDKEVAYAAWEAAAAVAPQQKHLMQGISAKSRPETISLAGTAAGFLGETGNTEFIDPILSTVERLSRVMEMGKHPEETGRALISCARAVGSLDQSPATFNRLKDASERIQGRRPFYTDFLGGFWEAEASASMLEPSIKGIDTTAPERGKSSLLGEFERRRSSLKSDDIDGHYDLGLWCVGNNLLDEGIGMLEETIKLQPSNSFAHFQLGKAYAAVGNYCEARRRLGHAVRNMSNPVKKKPPELVEKLREWDELEGLESRHR
jgi:tetratricopeptide (TPR) repeat protein